MNTRRNLLVACAAIAMANPLDSFAQKQGKVWRVGLLYVLSRQSSEERNRAFLEAMREFGYVEGKSLVIEGRYADGQIERLPGLAAELVQLKVDAIVTGGSPGTSAAQKATATIPIIMGNGNDPIREGFVKSLAHPGGNITGLSNIAGDVSPKQLEMLLSMVPRLSGVAVMVNPANSSHAMLLKNVQAVAQRTSARILPVEARNLQEIETAFVAMSKQKAGAVMILLDGLFIQQARQIAELAAKHQLPSISTIREYVDAGGLMSYGSNITDQFRRAATYVDKIFKGAKPADLPVEQSTKFELLINRKTAKQLGLTIPQSLLISAEKIVE